MNIVAGQARIVGQPANLPTRQSPVGADPQSSVAPGDQGTDETAGETFTRRGLPLHNPNAIETYQAGIRAEPEIAVRRLRDGEHLRLEKALANGPRLVRILIDLERRV